MQTYIKNDLNQTYLILEGTAQSQEDYQTIMLRENHISGILRTDVRNLDNQSYYYYDISGKTSLQSWYEQGVMRYEEMKQLVQDLLSAIENLEKYMLEGNGILLEPQFIFYDREQYYFCYYPFYPESVKEAFHKLTEFFVVKVDERDAKGVHFAYTFHKATMEPHYSIEEILKRLEPNMEQEQDVWSIQSDFEEIPVDEDASGQQEEQEKSGVWSKIRTFLEELFLQQEDDDEDL